MQTEVGALDQPGEICTLVNPVFTRLENVSFRRSETDGTPVMAMRLGERDAVVSIYALQRELNIDDASSDGRMLNLIVQSLDFVQDLHPGDRFPREVIDGTASWTPSTQHRQTATERLQRALIAWLDSERDDAAGDPSAARDLEGNAQLRDRINMAMRLAAESLRLASTEDVVTLIETLADELSYIEALRDRLLSPVQIGMATLARFASAYQGDGDRLEVMTRVRRLSEIALGDLASRFAEVDAQTGEILPMLRNAESQRTFIRSHRDTLYRNLRAWEPTLRLWATLGRELGEDGWLSIMRTYQFLAQHYMQSQEWIAAQKPRPARTAKSIGTSMTW